MGENSHTMTDITVPQVVSQKPVQQHLVTTSDMQIGLKNGSDALADQSRPLNPTEMQTLFRNYSEWLRQQRGRNKQATVKSSRKIMKKMRKELLAQCRNMTEDKCNITDHECSGNESEITEREYDGISEAERKPTHPNTTKNDTSRLTRGMETPKPTQTKQQVNPPCDSTVWSMGSNNSGELGSLVRRSSSKPVSMEQVQLLDICQASCGDGFSVLLSQAGEAYVFGRVWKNKLEPSRARNCVTNKPSHGKVISQRPSSQQRTMRNHFQASTSGLVASLQRIQLPREFHVTQVSCGQNHVVLLDQSGNCFSFGNGKDGKLGLGDRNSRSLPEMLTACRASASSSEEHRMPPVQLVACGESHTLFVGEQGRLFSCGSGKVGQTGHAQHRDALLPTRVTAVAVARGMQQSSSCDDLGVVVGVSCGTNHSAVWNESGMVFTFGWGEFGRLGYEALDGAQVVPQQVNLGINDEVIEVACGGSHTVVLFKSGNVHGFGWNEFGQLGSIRSNSSQRKVRISNPVQILDKPRCVLKPSEIPLPVELQSRVRKVYCGFGHTLLFDDSGTLWTLGFNGEGQLGTADETNQLNPVKVQFATSPSNVQVKVKNKRICCAAAGKTHSIVIQKRILSAKEILNRKSAARIIQKAMKNFFGTITESDQNSSKKAQVVDEEDKCQLDQIAKDIMYQQQQQAENESLAKEIEKKKAAKYFRDKVALLSKQRKAAILLQKLVRGKLIRQHLKESVNQEKDDNISDVHAAVCIQRRIRVVLARKLFMDRIWSMKRNNASNLIGKWWRNLLLRFKVHKLCMAKLRINKFLMNVITLQRQQNRKTSIVARFLIFWIHTWKLKRQCNEATVILQRFARKCLQNQKQESSDSKTKLQQQHSQSTSNTVNGKQELHSTEQQLGNEVTTSVSSEKQTETTFKAFQEPETLISPQEAPVEKVPLSTSTIISRDVELTWIEGDPHASYQVQREQQHRKKTRRLDIKPKRPNSRKEMKPNQEATPKRLLQHHQPHRQRFQQQRKIVNHVVVTSAQSRIPRKPKLPPESRRLSKVVHGDSNQTNPTSLKPVLLHKSKKGKVKESRIRSIGKLNSIVTNRQEAERNELKYLKQVELLENQNLVAQRIRNNIDQTSGQVKAPLPPISHGSDELTFV